MAPLLDRLDSLAPSYSLIAATLELTGGWHRSRHRQRIVSLRHGINDAQRGDAVQSSICAAVRYALLVIFVVRIFRILVITVVDRLVPFDLSFSDWRQYSSMRLLHALTATRTPMRLLLAGSALSRHLAVISKKSLCMILTQSVSLLYDSLIERRRRKQKIARS